MARPLLSRPLDLLFVAYFIIHVPITILFDIQSLFPRSYFPEFAVKMLDWHIKTNKDHLVHENPVWFVSLVWCELIFQLPAQVIILVGLLKEASWVRIPALVYGAHVTTTMIPILGEFIFGTNPAVPNWPSVGVYCPWLFIPLAITLRMALADYGSSSSSGSKGGRSKRSKAA